MPGEIAAGGKWLIGQDVCLIGGGQVTTGSQGGRLGFWHEQWDRSLGCLLLRGGYHHGEGGRQGWGKVSPSGLVKLDLCLDSQAGVPGRNWVCVLGPQKKGQAQVTI